MLELVFLQGPNRGAVVPLNPRGATFGRQDTCDFVLEGDEISRVQFTISRRGIYDVLIDDQSTNGTFINRVPVTEATLRAGDQINVGRHVILVREGSGAQPGFRFVTEWKGGESGVQVFERKSILLGRQNICQVQLNEPDVAVVHAELEQRPDGIWITDRTSGAGLYVNGQRVVSQLLQDGDRIRIRHFEITIRLADGMCVLTVDQSPIDATLPVELPETYRSVVPVPKTTAEGSKPSASIAALPVWMQEKAPIWVPTSDILPNRFRAPMLLAALLAVLGCAAYAWGARSHSFLSPGPVSNPHSSFECASCHTGFSKVREEACQTCHSDVKPASSPAAAVHASFACTSCHSEHRGRDFDVARNAGDGCQSAGCHVTVHQKLKPVAGSMPDAVAFEARFADFKKKPDDALHVKHKAAQLDCKACHDTENPTSADPKAPVETVLVKAPEMRLRCLGCHGFGPEATLRARCYSCHFQHATEPAKMLATVKFTDSPPVRASVGETNYTASILLFFAALGAVPLLYVGAMAVSFRLEDKSARARTLASVNAPKPPVLESVPSQPDPKLPKEVLPGKAVQEVSESKAAETPAGASNLRPKIDLDLCVGCGTCAHVCPFEVLDIINEKAVAVRMENCTGFAACAAECPTEAIVLVSGGPLQKQELPVYNAGLETNVPGLFMAGEITGKALIKVAINQGKTVVDSILRNRPAPGDGYDAIVIGAGPAGVSAALAAKQGGLKVVALEQGTIASTIRSYPRQKFVMAEPVSIPLYGPLYMQETSKESLLQKWEEIIETTKLEVHLEEKVLQVTKGPEHFLVKTTKGEYKGSRVVLAIGKRGTPRKLGVPGEDSAKVMYSLSDAGAYHNKAICVVGGGDSGIEAAVGLARPNLENRVWVVHRTGDFSKAKSRNQKKIQKTMDEGRITVFFNSAVTEIREDSVTVKTPNSVEVIENDFVFVMVGGENPKGFLTQCGIEFSERALT